MINFFAALTCDVGACNSKIKLNGTKSFYNNNIISNCTTAFNLHVLDRLGDDYNF